VTHRQLAITRKNLLRESAQGYQIADNGFMSAPRLVPFIVADLPSVAAWFDDPETRRWLGDRRWWEMILRLADDPPTGPRGRRVVERRAWIVEEGDVRVGMIDVEVYDDRTAGLAFVVGRPTVAAVWRDERWTPSRGNLLLTVCKKSSVALRPRTQRAYAAWRPPASAADRANLTRRACSNSLASWLKAAGWCPKVVGACCWARPVHGKGCAHRLRQRASDHLLSPGSADAQAH